MSNPWPTPTPPTPAGYKTDAVVLLHRALGVSSFEMAKRLGITVSELGECERQGRWPHGEKARAGLIEQAHEHFVNIGSGDTSAPESTLF